MEIKIKQLLEYFKVENAGDIIWSHAVNSKEKLAKCVSNPKLMMIESDIRISDEKKVITAHPPATTSDLSFNELMREIAKTDKGIKLDFKDAEVLDYCLDYLKKNPLDQPVMLNADILRGNGAKDPKIAANKFIKNCLTYYSQGILSLGWTTTADTNFPYSENNVKEMIELSKNLETDIILPVRACLMPNSWNNFKKIFEIEKYWLSFWNNELIDKNLLNWIKTNTDYQKTFYDFIENGESVKII